MLHILHVIIGERHSIRTMRHLEVISLNGLLLSRLEPVLLAPVADLSEWEIEVFARRANPITHPFCEGLLYLRLLLLLYIVVVTLMVAVFVVMERELINLLLDCWKVLVVRRVLKIDVVLFVAEFKWLINLWSLMFWLLMHELTIKRTMLENHPAFILDRSSSRDKLLLRGEVRSSIILFEEMLRLTVEILLSFNFLASIAFDSSVKIVILALRADPSTIRKIELRFSLHLSGLKLTLRNKVRVVILNSVY